MTLISVAAVVPSCALSPIQTPTKASTNITAPTATNANANAVKCGSGPLMSALKKILLSG